MTTLSGDEAALARRMWSLFEPVHVVTYFTPEARRRTGVLGSEPHTDLYDAVTDTLAAHGCLGRETRCARLA